MSYVPCLAIADMNLKLKLPRQFPRAALKLAFIPAHLQCRPDSTSLLLPSLSPSSAAAFLIRAEIDCGREPRQLCGMLARGEH